MGAGVTVRAAAFPRRYPMVVVSVTDGDTVKAFLDRGGDDWWLVKVRLHGIACRESHDDGGPEARAYTTGLVASITPPTLPDMFLPRWQGGCEALKWDKYAGRVQGRVWIPGSPVDVSTVLVSVGYAVPWDGNGTQPKPPWPIPVPQ